MISFNIKPKIDQSWTILKISEEAYPSSWEDVFKEAKPELAHISKKLDDEKRFGEYLPRKEDLFNAFKFTPLNKIQVVILHDQPVHTMTTINNKTLPKDYGMAFSLRPEDTLSPVLKTIYQELLNEYPTYNQPSHGDLRHWCQQGVLLINKCLTISKQQSHLKWDLWLGFLNKVFKAITKVNPYTIFLLWGQEAQKVIPMLPDSFIVLETSSPSGYFANCGFLGCNHFKMVNDELIKQKRTPIDWQIK
jgi:uracil-DNA glycosylase